MKSAIVKAPALEGKGFSQYEAVFLQLADEHRTVNAFELQELLEACLPNGKNFREKIFSIEWKCTLALLQIKLFNLRESKKTDTFFLTKNTFWKLDNLISIFFCCM